LGDFFLGVKMQYIDLKKQFDIIGQDVRSKIEAVFEHGQYVLGPEVTQFEQIAADFVGAKHCVGVSSGTSALSLALLALNIGPGDEVITTPFSFFATVECIIIRGATPVFVDIDPVTYNLDAAKIEAAITPKTKAIMTVDLYGSCPDYAQIQAIADKHDLFVIEDAAQSFGGSHAGKMACSFGDIACTSFFPSKPLGCFGDGGACFTDDDELAEKIRQLSNHGQYARYKYSQVGLNARLDTLQAAILLAKMPIFQKELEAREQVAGWYADCLKKVTPPAVREGDQSAWAQYTVEVSDRDALQAKLREKGIPTAVHYPETFLDMPLVQKHTREDQAPCPHAQAAASRVISLPFHPYMTQEEVTEVAEALAEAV
jgi:UDP-2-acetamido-2-deoxy-ribo-hexuluronate aminotransferase